MAQLLPDYGLPRGTRTMACADLTGLKYSLTVTVVDYKASLRSLQVKVCASHSSWTPFSLPLPFPACRLPALS